MSYTLIVRRRAEHELAEAGLWYESRRPGAGLHFLPCVDAAIALIARYPRAGKKQFGVSRRVLVARFPFSIFYSFQDETIVVHGVLHSAREPVEIRRLLHADEP